MQKVLVGIDVGTTRIKVVVTDLQLNLLQQDAVATPWVHTNNLSEIELEPGTADFRLMSKRVVEIFSQFTEADIFMRGMIKWMGFQQIGIEYTAANRGSGISKYTVKKMMRLALQGITSFSTKPLYIAAYLGLFFSIC